MSDKLKIKAKAMQKISQLKTDLSMMENGLRVVDTKQNSILWLSHIRQDLGSLQTLINEYYEANN